MPLSPLSGYKPAICLFILLLLFEVHGAEAQNSQLDFSHLSTSHGLSNIHVTDIAQDEMGFLWFGTQNGLNRYDGNTFKVYKNNPQDSRSIAGSSVNCSLIDRKGNLWIGTTQGLSLYSREKDHFINFGETPLLSQNNIRCLYEDKNGFLWMGTRMGLVRYDSRTGEAKIYTKDNSNLSHNIVRAIYEDKNGKFWIGTFNGLSYFDPLQGKCRNFNLNPGYAGDPDNNLVTSILPSSSDSIIYVGTETGFCRFNIHTCRHQVFRKENTPGILNNVIKTMTRIDEQTVWLGTDGGLLIREDGRFRSVLYNPFEDNTLPNNVVWKIYQDNAGILWVATNNGIGKYNPQNSMFSFIKLVSPEAPQYHGLNIHDFLFQDDANCWVSTQYGLADYNLKNGALTWFNSTNTQNGTLNPYRSLYLDKQQNLWIGASEGLTCFDTRKRMYINLNRFDIPKTKYTNWIAPVNDQVFWIGDLFGNLIRYNLAYNGSQLAGIETDSYYIDGGVWGLAADSDANVWIASKKGLVKFMPESNKFYNYSENAKSNFPANPNISCMHKDKNGKIWIATDKGLYSYNSQNDTFDKTGAIADQITLYRIEDDEKGNLWLASNKGILKYELQTGRLSYHDLSFHKNFLQSINASSGKDTEGNIYFGGIDGFIRFHPDRIHLRESNSRLFITDIKLFSKSLAVDDDILTRQAPLTGKITLPHHKNGLAFSFALLDYTAPELTEYEYRLENFDKEWIKTSEANNQAIYSNLAPGKYTFRVKAYTAGGSVNAREASLELVLRPPWWRTGWAMLLYLVLLSVTVFTIRKQRQSKRALKTALGKEILEREKTEEVNQIKLRFFTNISHEFRTPLSLLLGPLDNMLAEKPDEKNKKRLMLMRQNAERLLRLINQIIDFRKIENQKMDINLEQGELIAFARNIFNSFMELAEKKKLDLLFETTESRIPTLFDADKMDKILFNLLSNAIKFTPEGGEVTLSVALYNKEIEISVKDSGIGIPEKDIFHIFDRFYQVKEHHSVTSNSSGIGLTLVKEFVELHGGDLQVRSAENEGSCFTIILPHKPVTAGTLPETKTADGIPENEVKENGLRTDADKKTVLMVEDNEEMREYILFELTDTFRILTAGNGREGLALAEKENPDLVVSDIMMPVMDGYELCKRLKTGFVTSHIPVILLTAKSAEESVIKGYDAGADAYIGKPFNIRILKSRIENLIYQREVIKEAHRRSIITTPKAYDKQSPDEIFLGKLVKLIENNISDPELNIQKVCDELGISHMQLYRKLKALVGQNINEFIRTIRLKKAAQLLTVKGFNVSEVMFEVGFNSRSYFSKCFNELYGMYPKEYMKRHGNASDTAGEKEV